MAQQGLLFTDLLISEITNFRRQSVQIQRSLPWQCSSLVSLMFHETPANKTFDTSGDQLDDQGIEVQFPAEAKEFSQKPPYRLWGPNSLPFGGYRDKFTRVFSSQAVQLHLVPRLRTNGAVPPLSICTGVSCIIVKDATLCGHTAVVWSTDTVYEVSNCKYQYLLCSVLLHQCQHYSY